jgi:hypothetical protein
VAPVRRGTHLTSQADFTWFRRAASRDQPEGQVPPVTTVSVQAVSRTLLNFVPAASTGLRFGPRRGNLQTGPASASGRKTPGASLLGGSHCLRSLTRAGLWTGLLRRPVA